MSNTNAVNTEKDKALQQALDQIQRQFGKGAIMKLGEAGPVSNIEVILQLVTRTVFRYGGFLYGLD